MVFAADWMGLLAREVLRERAAALIAEACAWGVGLSDSPYYLRRHGRIVDSALTLGTRAAAGQQLGNDEDGRLELGDARPGSFQDALNALAADGKLHGDRLEEHVLVSFVLDSCVLAAERVRRTRPELWTELVDELGEDEADPVAVVRAGEWEAPLRIEAEHLVLAALGELPLVEVEAEGLPLSLVRAAEAVARDVAPAAPASAEEDDDLAGAGFLAEVALREAELTLPVPPEQAGELMDALAGQGLEPQEVLGLLPRLPVQPDTADAVAAKIAQLPDAGS